MGLGFRVWGDSFGVFIGFEGFSRVTSKGSLILLLLLLLLFYFFFFGGGGGDFPRWRASGVWGLEV